MKFEKRNNTIIDEGKISSLSNSLNISNLSARILLERGYDTLDSSKDYLGLSERKFSNPYDISNMHDAVVRINEAISQKQNIVVYSDYDTDGVCGCSILLNGFDRAGYSNVSYYTPERVGEGYGLNAEAIGTLRNEKCNLLITVDCGISNVEEIKLAKFLGIDVIVTDHHSCPPKLPDCIIVNPKLSGSQGQENLCGAAVAMKLSQAVFGGSSDNREMELAAIATVADMVPLKGENRYIVTKGLEIINTNPSKVMKELIDMAIGEKDVSSEDISFKLGPIINAAGRISTAHICVDLFTGRTDDIKDKVTELIGYNNERKDIQNNVYIEAKSKVKDLDLINNNGIVLYEENWTLGVVGIVASRLMNDYGRPIVMLTKSNKQIKGSIRSVDGINIFDVLSNISELFSSFGGHSKAAGITLKNENVAEFADKFNRELDVFDKALFDKTVYYDIACEPDEIDLATVKEIAQMEPFGQDNPSINLLIESAKVSDYYTMGKDKNHYRTNFVKGDNAIKGVGFFSSLEDGVTIGNMLCDVVVTPSINEYNGHVSVQGMINGVKTYYKSEDDYTKFIDSIEDKFIASRVQCENITADDTDIEYEAVNIEEVRNTLLNTSYQNLVVVDDINIAKVLYNVLTNKVMNRTHIAADDIEESVNGANTILLAPNYDELKSNIYTRVYYISVNENQNIIKRLSQLLHDNIQMVIMGDIISAHVKTITIERLREIYKVLRNSKENKLSNLEAMALRADIRKHEIMIAREVFAEAGLMVVDEEKNEYTIKSKATTEVIDTLAYKKYINE